MSLIGVPTSTYSIIAIDRDAGLLGVAVQSHFFSVGSVVPWAEAGVGAVVTQSVVNVVFGPRGLVLLREGYVPTEVLDKLLGEDNSPELRQVAVMGRDGATATHTGHRCISEAGHIAMDRLTIQANMMDRPGVPEAMADAFLSASKPLPERLLTALEAAETVGGDIRGRQSAAIVIVTTDASGDPRFDRPIDLRVDDDPDPLRELRRLLRLRRAYDAAERGDAALSRGDRDEAYREYAGASKCAPEKTELQFWSAISQASAGDIATGRDKLEAIESPDIVNPGKWHRLAGRLPQTGLFDLATPEWDALVSPHPGLVYHVLTMAELDLYGIPVPSTPGPPPTNPVLSAIDSESLATEGFIHCSFRHQIEGVLQRHYPRESSVVLAEIDPERCEAELRIEDLYRLGEAYPHLYGKIPFSAVLRLVPICTV